MTMFDFPFGSNNNITSKQVLILYHINVGRSERMDITDADISCLQEEMDKGHLSSKELTIAYLKRIR